VATGDSRLLDQGTPRHSSDINVILYLAYFWTRGKMRVTMTIRALVMFSGAGGSSWGAREAGAEIVAAFDLWPLAGEAHELNFPETEFILGRLEEMDVNALAKRLGPIDLIIASPECTNHSPAKGSKPRCEQSKDTAFQVVRFAKAFKPRWIAIENVVNMRKWTRYAEYKAALEKLGYQLQEQVLNSEHFGVPQSRRRLFLVADNQKMPRMVTPRKAEPQKVADIVDLNGTYRWTPLRQPKRAKATLERAERGIATLGKSKPFLLVYYGSDGAGGWQRLNRPLRTITTVDRFALVKPDAEHGHVMRMLQVPELQAAMGMPPKMKFETGTRRERIKMIGNAVCPPVMKQVVKQLVSENE
jgi:DNA (cytosine-5)-methyltransferase 1